MIDIIEKTGSSIIQHGKYNDRAYLMKLAKDDVPGIIDKLNNLAADGNYSKIFAKVPASALDSFETDGYVTEAYIPGFFDNDEDAYFMGKFLLKERWYVYHEEQLDWIIERAKSMYLKRRLGAIPGRYRFAVPTKSDTQEMASLYRQVFKTYPFPIYDPDYIAATMDENIVYFAILFEDKIIALSSAEIDIDSKSVEMTDFATLPQHRGNRLATHLLQNMEESMFDRGIKTSYTIARASSYGINSVFAGLGYSYGGTLTNNTNISGSLESMNVWYKKLS